MFFNGEVRATYELGDTVGRTGVEGGSLALGGLDDLTVELRGGGLVETAVLLETGGTDGIEHTESAEAVDITGVLGELERDLDVGLGAEVVDLGGLDLRNNVDEVGSVGQVTVVKDHLGCQQLRKGLAGRVEWRKGSVDADQGQCRDGVGARWCGAG